MGGGSTPAPSPPPTNYIFWSKNENAWNVLKRKNMREYIVKFLQGYPLKTFFQIIFFILKNHPFKTFLVSKTCINVFMYKKTFITLLCPLLTARGAGYGRWWGGGQGFSGRVRKECDFFKVLPYLFYVYL